MRNRRIRQKNLAAEEASVRNNTYQFVRNQYLDQILRQKYPQKDPYRPLVFVLDKNQRSKTEEVALKRSKDKLKEASYLSLSLEQPQTIFSTIQTESPDLERLSKKPRVTHLTLQWLIIRES